LPNKADSGGSFHEETGNKKTNEVAIKYDLEWGVVIAKGVHVIF